MIFDLHNGHRVVFMIDPISLDVAVSSKSKSITRRLKYFQIFMGYHIFRKKSFHQMQNLPRVAPAKQPPILFHIPGRGESPPSYIFWHLN